MCIEFEFKDENGLDLELGDRVVVYQRQYEGRVVRETDDGSAQVVELDLNTPKPSPDIPQFEGVLRWNSEESVLEVHIERMLVKWEHAPSSVRVCRVFCSLYKIPS